MFQKMSRLNRFSFTAFYFCLTIILCTYYTAGANGSINTIKTGTSGALMLTPESCPTGFESIRLPTLLDPQKNYSFSLYLHTGQKVWERKFKPGNSVLTGSLLPEFNLPVGWYLYRVCESEPSDFVPDYLEGVFFTDASQHLPGDSTRTGFCEFFDANNDNAPDIIVGLYDLALLRRPVLFMNDGSGNFLNESQTRLPDIGLIVNDVAAFDADSDGDTDLYFACTDFGQPLQSVDRLYLNDGQGYFSDASATHLPPVQGFSNNVTTGFVNSDSFPDVLLCQMKIYSGPAQTPLTILINDGTGHFSDQTGSLLPVSKYGAFDAAVADVNGDSLNDILLANILTTFTGPPGNPLDSLSGQNAVFIQQINGSFLDETVTRLPADNRWSKLVKITDINQDGINDFYTINFGFSPAEATNMLYVNDGSGVFQDQTASRMPPEVYVWNNDADFCDFDRDGQLDFFMINVIPGGPAPDYLYENEDGVFTDYSQYLPNIIDFNASCSAGDFDGDSYYDLFISVDTSLLLTNWNGLPDLLYRNESVTGIPGTGGQAVVGSARLSPNYPNPFNSTTNIVFEIPRTGRTQGEFVELNIYDVLGQKIRSLVSENISPGTYKVVWDGRDDYGREMSSGVYIYRLKADEFSASRKLLIIR